MKLKRAGSWIIFGIACLLLPPGPTSAVDDEWERLTRATLKGLQGVHVLVEKMHPEAARAGLAKATLQTDVEVKLRQAGIRVLSKTETLAAPGNPFLYLQVGTLVGGAASEFYVYSIRLSLTQLVVLDRNAAVITAPTWSAAQRIGTIGSARLSTIVREHVRDQVDQFINAWLSVNPK